MYTYNQMLKSFFNFLLHKFVISVFLSFIFVVVYKKTCKNNTSSVIISDKQSF